MTTTLTIENITGIQLYPKENKAIITFESDEKINSTKKRSKGNHIESREREVISNLIIKNCKCFGGNKTDAEVMKMCGISITTFYRMKKELKESMYIL